jgi:RND superfamily putative drug exporter
MRVQAREASSLGFSVGSPGPKPAKRARHGYLNGVARFVTRRPRLVIAVWIATVLALGALGTGLEGKLSTDPVVLPGSEAERAQSIVKREFGADNAFIVLLSGPRQEIESQGRKLARKLDEAPRTVVSTPWQQGSAIEGLRPSATELALLITVRRLSGESLTDLTSPVRQAVDETVTAPVGADLAGAPVLMESFREASADAVEQGEKLALPLLLIILLFVFRSVLAAAIPVVIGGAVVAMTKGVLALLAESMPIDGLAMAGVGMMGLALGVDYALLIVSRFREELKKSDDVASAAQETVHATGRSVVPAGCGLLLAMFVSTLVLPGSLIVSVALAISVASTLSVLSAIVVAPAILTLLGTRLDRWTLPRRRASRAAKSHWTQRLTRRPGVVWPIVLLLILAAGWAFTLESDAGTVALLPSDDPGRLQQEKVQEALGPGWVAPLEIAIDGHGETITTRSRLRALADFQRRVERDPDVASMTGFAGIERSTRPLGEFEGKLTSQQRGLDRLGRGIGRAAEGAGAGAGGLSRAADGAQQLDSALGETHAGANLLSQGVSAASQGSAQLSDGLGRASDGTSELARGTEKTSVGAGRLSAGLDKAAKGAAEAVGSSRVLKNAMHAGSTWLIGLHGPLRSTEAQLATARQALETMTAGRDDPQFAAALAAVNAASRGLSGDDPASGEQIDPAYEGVEAGIVHAQNQFSLGTYLSNQIGKNSRRGRDGLAKLARGSARLDRGLQRLAGGSDQVSGAIARLSRGGQQLSPALARLSRGTERLAGGLGEVQNGAAGLAAGLGNGAQGSKLLAGALGRIHSGVERQQDSADTSQLAGAPGLFKSGYFYLAGLDGAKPEQRAHAALLLNVDKGGSAARMLVVPASDPAGTEIRELADRLRGDTAELGRQTGTEVAVGGQVAASIDIDTVLREKAPLARLALCLVTLIVLIPVTRSLTLPLIAALLNLLTISATIGLLAVLFNDSLFGGALLGGPGYVDTVVLPATIMVMFGLAIDYEVFLFARMREEYVRTGSARAAVDNGLGTTGHVITGAAFIMITVFLLFSLSEFATLRNFGVAQALAVFIDAFIIRLVVLPLLMRALGERSWWIPGWLDRLLPGGGRPVATGEPALMGGPA